MNTAWFRSELTYCTNVHPGENLAQVSEIVNGPLSTIRQNRGLSSMAGGLWLSHPTAVELSSAESLQRFSGELDSNGITLFTLNGFPARGFHSPRVKEAVYHPDWSEPERLAYTIKLAHILAAFLPHDIAEGTISSVPLGFAPDWDKKRHSRAMDALSQCLVEFEKIHLQSGRRIRLCLEMEPGCVLESTNDLIPFFTTELPQHFINRGLDPNLIKQYLGICFDVCHQAVMFEDTYKALTRIHDAEINIGKIQISSALELKAPNDKHARDSLAGFVEQKYLHQSRCMGDNNRRYEVMDLDLAFTTFPVNHAWRTHFHVPIQAETLISDGLATTQGEICRTLDFLRDNPGLHPHLEVETYTWTALPKQIRPKDENTMVDGLCTELRWLEAQMLSRGLLQDQER